ncbi:MFS general substrate transporter [Lentinula edodes]|uniref:MFS general substrate transporter n=1 Tax=Lentinula lateritia TaxID=40482 RepID=A0A9W9AF73_9AGAR|nr:MFS general substrate transporter [Lentinula edodes]
MATHEPDQKNLEEIPVDEKAFPVSPVFEHLRSDSIEESDTSVDEALQLVGKERTSEFSDEFNRRVRKKLDLLIPPLCAAVYFTQFLDKTSLNYASIMGLPITGQNYNLVSMAFYLGFLLFEFPTVYISQKTRAAKYLGVNIVLWGVILMLHAVGSSFGAFFALRFLLGMCESCVAPTLILIISMFYKKDEQASRISWFYVMNGLTQVFGGFIAYGVSFSNDSHIAPYKIIYVLLGGLAIIVGFSVLIWLPDSPVHAHFLDQEERIAALERVRNDQGGVANKKIKRKQILEAFTDIRTWLIVLTTMMTSIPNGALSNFSNIIIRNFGYTYVQSYSWMSSALFRRTDRFGSSRQTLILSTPAGAVASLMTLFCGWYSDRKNERMIPIIIALVPTIVGAAMLIGLNDSGKKGALLFATYLIGTFGSSLSTVYAYNASNTSGHTKKSTVNAMTLLTFSIGNIVGTEIFLPKDAPAYIPGKIAIMVLLTVQLGISLLLRCINLRLNRRKFAQIEELKRSRGWTEADVQKEREKHAFMDLTDQENIYFVYTA